MAAIVFINCSRHPFIDWIMSDRRSERKTDETRTRNTLRSLIGQRVLLARTGCGPSMVYCSAVIRSVKEIRSRSEWNRSRSRHRVPSGSVYDWKPETRVKYAYTLDDVVPVPVPFHPPEGVRHGRVWMEIDDNIITLLFDS